jgi:hypothetical protein
MRAQDNFDTADLHEQKNTRQVQIALLALGRAAYSIAGYDGPCVGKKPVAVAPRKKHTQVKIEGLWGKAGGVAPKAGYTTAVGQVDTSTSILPSANANKARYRRKKSPVKMDGGGDGAGAGDDEDDDEEEMDFGDLDDLVDDSSPTPAGQQEQEQQAEEEAKAAAAAAAAAAAEALAAEEKAAEAAAAAAAEAAAAEEQKRQRAAEKERVAAEAAAAEAAALAKVAAEEEAAEIKRAAEAEAAAIKQAAIEEVQADAARIAAEAEAARASAAEESQSQPQPQPQDDEDFDAEIAAEEAEIAAEEAEMAAEEAAEKAAAAAKLKAAAAAKAKKKEAAVTERPPPNPDWVRPPSAPATGPYAGSYDLEAPMEELACTWVSEVSGLAAASLEDLKDGVTLCELCNVLVPGAVKRINRSSMPFPQVSHDDQTYIHTCVLACLTARLLACLHNQPIAASVCVLGCRR